VSENLASAALASAHSAIDPAAAPLARLPLEWLHRSLGAKMAPFAGYDMPLQYAAGIVAEHLHTRTKAGLFDVSHMGQAILSGAGADRALETLVPGDLLGLAPERVRYTQLLNDAGGVIDDLMATRLPGRDERFMLVVNAATRARDFAHIAQKLPDHRLQNLDRRALLALQGPRAVDVLRTLLPGVEDMGFMSWRAFDLEGAGVYATRSGYTGEDGFEISIPVERVEAFARALLAHEDVLPIGLGARDSLRLEAGLSLYGHELDETINPVEAGLAWSIGKRRRAEGGFPGAESIHSALRDGPRRVRVGLLPQSKAPLREGAEIVDASGAVVGRITSGGFSPTLSRPIALGLVAREFATDGVVLGADLRGRRVELVVAPTPFVPHRYVKKDLR
jgi:aminomethyltransferase